MLKHLTLGLTALAIVATPAAGMAQGRGPETRAERQDRKDDKQDRKADRQDAKQARQDYRAQRNWQRDTNWQSQSRTWTQYDYNRPDPRYGSYYADRYYRQGSYQERRLGNNERLYRGQDGRYYCRRNDGSTGLVIGALGGGVLGNAIAPGGSKTLGAIIGGGLGALLGQSISRGGARCR